MASVAYAQVNFGPRIALTQTKLNVKSTNGNVAEGDASIGFQFGLFMRAELFGLTLQPEVLYTKSESEYLLRDQVFGLDLDRIDVPIMIGYKVEPVRLQAGPSFGFITEAVRY